MNRLATWSVLALAALGPGAALAEDTRGRLSALIDGVESASPVAGADQLRIYSDGKLKPNDIAACLQLADRIASLEANVERDLASTAQERSTLNRLAGEIDAAEQCVSGGDVAGRTALQDLIERHNQEVDRIDQLTARPLSAQTEELLAETRRFDQNCSGRKYYEADLEDIAKRVAAGTPQSRAERNRQPSHARSVEDDSAAMVRDAAQ